ncbi:MAG: hypothetical protein JWR75_521 [Devosia sp.]|nr:hypothetical protein [Devosia sp.]
MANNAMPSMMALLGLLAVAGYQNRDKLAGAVKGMQSNGGAAGVAGNNPVQDGLGGLMSSLGGLFGAGGAAGGLSGGFNDLLGSFKSAGHSEVADSWVTPGVPTQGLTPDQVAQAVGENNLSELATRTGLSRDELLQRLSKSIPETVDRLTPDGRMPTDEELHRNLMPS